MKKLGLLFVTIMFLATFALVGCNQTTPAPEKGATGAPGAPGAPGTPGTPGAPGSAAPANK